MTEVKGANILVVDDEPDLATLVERKFRHKIKDGAYKFKFAGNGEEALNVVRGDPDIDLVVSDINMPIMDGLTLIERLRDLNAELKTIIVSAYGDMDNIRAAMNRGAFDFVTKPVDFGDLEVTIGKTLEELRKLKALQDGKQEAERASANLSRYFAPSLVDMLANDAEVGVAREMQVAVLFVDIVGFTKLSSERSAEDVFALLNKFFDLMAQQVFEASGTLDKYMGDGLMATFGTPYPGRNDATNALRCATGMKEVAMAWNAKRVNLGHPAVKIAIGLHYGKAMVGHMGHRRRLEFATIGDTVNAASRIEGLARPLGASIVVSDDLVQAVQRESRMSSALLHGFKKREKQEIRGLEHPISVWTLA